MARPIATHDNTFTKAYLQQHCGDLLSFDGQGDLSGWLDDVLTGAGRLSESMASNTKPVSPYLILTQLLTHDTLTVSAVQESLSRKRVTLGEPMVSTRYARYVYAAVVSASKSVQYHASKAGS
ncbi:hypothetical protein E0396_02825 [Escherichia coli]|nr:hypothetical protein [Escherichia coli]EFA4561438.1 hypothetical protein [Escherichia coli]EFA4565813.1 hypothetical protein [Escherichia coli]